MANPHLVNGPIRDALMVAAFLINYGTRDELLAYGFRPELTDLIMQMRAAGIRPVE